MSSLAPKSIGGWSEICDQQPDADVTFKSSDNLSEESQTLELLFRFIYPPDVPDLADLPFKLLMELAQAAEKYIVHIAMPLCRVHVLYVKDDLKLIVKYATEHSYMNILDDTAPLLILEPLEVSIFWFPVEKQIFWALYRDQWLLVHRDACSSLSSHRTKGYCRFCNDSNVNLRATLYLQHLLTFNDFTRTQLPVHYCMQLPEWQKEVQERIEKIRKFSSICDQVIYRCSRCI
ncbi:hypothetical protein BDQ17DRAFT_1374609 [Cyathus striatus]|nr:hypothetical protein BDQ17DRAFT_1374609 [Cyathus striatus]